LAIELSNACAPIVNDLSPLWGNQVPAVGQSFRAGFYFTVAGLPAGTRPGFPGITSTAELPTGSYLTLDVTGTPIPTDGSKRCYWAQRTGSTGREWETYNNQAPYGAGEDIRKNRTPSTPQWPTFAVAPTVPEWREISLFGNQEPTGDTKSLRIMQTEFRRPNAAQNSGSPVPDASVGECFWRRTS
jgi:hypothetical protein